MCNKLYQWIWYYFDKPLDTKCFDFKYNAQRYTKIRNLVDIEYQQTLCIYKMCSKIK